MEPERSIQKFQGFIFDLDGTVYLGEKLISGADETILTLRNMGKKVVFLSNKPLYTREDYARKLTNMGIPTRASEVINSDGKVSFKSISTDQNLCYWRDFYHQ